MKTTIYDLYKLTGCTELVERRLCECGCISDHPYVQDLRYMGANDEMLEEILEREFGNKYVDEFLYFTIENETLTLEVAAPKCIDCELREYKNGEKIYCLDMPRPEGFENVTKYHGIVALSRDDLQQGIQHLKKVTTNPLYETCCATTPIGPIGVIFDAEVITASNIDLYSHVDNKGRYYDLTEYGDAYYGIIHYADQLGECDTEGRCCYDDNDELVTINNKVTAIWIKESAGNVYREAAKQLAIEYNVDVLVIESKNKYDYDYLEIGDDDMPF